MPGRHFKTLYEIAEDNYGFLTVDDARRVGIRPQRLAEMARRGSLQRQGLGLYRLDPFPAHALDSYRKATLWPYGVEGVLSHETALDLYELSDVNPAMIHITVPKRYRLRRREAPPVYRFHHEDLDALDITRHEGLPIVTPAKASVNATRRICAVTCCAKHWSKPENVACQSQRLRRAHARGRVRSRYCANTMSTPPPRRQPTTESSSVDRPPTMPRRAASAYGGCASASRRWCSLAHWSVYTRRNRPDDS